MHSCCNGLLKAIDAFLAKAEDDLEEQLAMEGFEDAADTVKDINSIEDEIAELLINERDAMLRAAKKFDSLEAFAEEFWEEFKENDDLSQSLYELFKKKFEEMLPKYADIYIATTDTAIKVSTIRLRTVDWMEHHTVELAEQMKLTSHEQIGKILTDGISEGKSIAEFTQDILDNKIRDEYYRARSVSITEVLTAHSAAQSEAYFQSPVVTKRMWRHTGGHRNSPRQNHVEMDGIEVETGYPYMLNGADGEVYYPMYPRDPSLPPGERINCHCIEQPVVDEEILGMTLDERQDLQQQIIDEDDEAWMAEADAAARERADAWRAEHGEKSE